MPSGGARARSGPAADPNSYRQLKKSDDWYTLPATYSGEIPAFPFVKSLAAERTMWASIWLKPQAERWAYLGLADQVAAYVRAYVESTARDASAGLKTAVLRMETELGISIAGMRQNRWKMPDPIEPASSGAPVARQTSTGSWMAAVSVEGA